MAFQKRIQRAHPVLARENESFIVSAAQFEDYSKLDDQIVLALKKSRGESPFDKPTSLEPDIPIQDGTSVLIDLRKKVTVF